MFKFFTKIFINNILLYLFLVCVVTLKASLLRRMKEMKPALPLVLVSHPILIRLLGMSGKIAW